MRGAQARYLTVANTYYSGAKNWLNASVLLSHFDFLAKLL
jgi:hypothetical protein